MRVYEMSARFSRKVQVKQFEPAEAEFEMKVELDETDDPTAVRTLIMQEVRDAVTQAFQGRAGKGAEVKVTTKTKEGEGARDVKLEDVEGEVVETVEEEKPKRGRPPGSKNKPKEEAAEDVASVLDMVPNGEDKQESNIINLNPSPEPEEEEEKPDLTLAQVKTLMNKVTGDGVKVPKVRDLLAQFGVASTTELDPSAYPEFYDLLSEIKDEELQL